MSAGRPLSHRRLQLQWKDWLKEKNLHCACCKAQENEDPASNSDMVAAFIVVMVVFVYVGFYMVVYKTAML